MLLKHTSLLFLRDMSLSVPVLQDGTTPLSAASQGGHVEVVDCLIKNGANVDKPDKVNNYEYVHMCENLVEV